MKPYIVHLQYLRLNKCKKASNEVTMQVMYSENLNESVFSLIIKRNKVPQLNQNKYFIETTLVIWVDI